MMINKIFFTLIGFLIISCDCQIRVDGIILNQETGDPIPNIAIGRTDTTDLDNPFNVKTYTNKDGHFDYMGIAGKCDNITLDFSGNGFLTKKVLLNNRNSDSIYLSPDVNNVLLENSTEIKFSSTDTKDRFIISLAGQSIINGKVSFKIFNSNGKKLWNEEFIAMDLIGYGLDSESSVDDKEEYIKSRILDFFKQENFINPAIKIDEKYDSDYSEENIWDDIKSDPFTIGFYYMIGEERGCRIAYSKKLKKIVTYFCCC